MRVPASVILLSVTLIWVSDLACLKSDECILVLICISLIPTWAENLTCLLAVWTSTFEGIALQFIWKHRSCEFFMHAMKIFFWLMIYKHSLSFYWSFSHYLDGSVWTCFKFWWILPFHFLSYPRPLKLIPRSYYFFIFFYSFSFEKWTYCRGKGPAKETYPDPETRARERNTLWVWNQSQRNTFWPWNQSQGRGDNDDDDDYDDDNNNNNKVLALKLEPKKHILPLTNWVQNHPISVHKI